MKRKGWICLAACLLALLLTACGQTAVEYPELAEIDLESMELSSQENSLVRVSYDPENWVPQPMTDPMMLAYAPTVEEEFCVNLTVTYTGESSKKPDEAYMKELAEEMERINGDFMTLELSEMRQVQGNPVVYLESAFVLNDAAIDNMIAEGEWSEEWLDSLGGRDAIRGITCRTVNDYACVEKRAYVYTGSYYDDAHKEPLLAALATAIATTEWVGP